MERDLSATTPGWGINMDGGGDVGIALFSKHSRKPRFFIGDPDAPRDKCAHFREINGIAAAFQYLQKNYNPTAPSSL